jgi:maltose O-acetyltransferase
MLRRLWSAALRVKRARYIARLCGRGLKLGENVSLQDGVFLDPSHCYLIEIGARCVLAPNVRLIAHDASSKCVVGATRLASIVIGEDCFIGDSTIVLPGVTIGRASIIGAGSVVTRSIPPGSVAAGNPARLISTLGAFRDQQADLMALGQSFSADYWIGSATKEQIAELVVAASSSGRGAYLI